MTTDFKLPEATRVSLEQVGSIADAMLQYAREHVAQAMPVTGPVEMAARMNIIAAHMVAQSVLMGLGALGMSSAHHLGEATKAILAPLGAMAEAAGAVTPAARDRYYAGKDNATSQG